MPQTLFREEAYSPAIIQYVTRKEPTAKELEEFAAQFTKAQWERLCRDREFLTMVSVNLIKAKVLAKRLLKN